MSPDKNPLVNTATLRKRFKPISNPVGDVLLLKHKTKLNDERIYQKGVLKTCLKNRKQKIFKQK